MNFKEKVGPLPVYAWGIILGVAIVGFVWFSRLKGGMVTAAPASSDSSATLTGWRDSSGVPVSAVSSPINAGDVSGVEVSNNTWLTQAVKWATANGFTALDAERALRNYLNGVSLSGKDSQVVNAVNAQLGLPPQGIADLPDVDTSLPESGPTLYVKKEGSPAIFAVYSNKKRRWLTVAEWTALGSPQPVTIPASDPIWSYPLVGIDAPSNLFS